MRRFGRPAIAKLSERLHKVGSGAAVEFFSILMTANSEFLAFALSRQGPFTNLAQTVSMEKVECAMSSMLLYSTMQFARDAVLRDDSELIPLLAEIIASDPKDVMLRRDRIRKAPKSEEWILYTWLCEDLGGARPRYDQALERGFSYNYLAYLEQYRPALEAALARLET